MKKLVLLFVAVVFAFALVPAAFAHSGGTDANGGHIDSSTGEYHYHHGYPAHQHEDLDGDGVPDCPYDFVVRKDPVSSSTQSSSNIAPVSTPEPSPSPEPNSILKSKALWIGLSVGICVVALFVKIKIDKKREALEEAARKQKEHEQWLAEKAEYTKQYGGRTSLELAGTPPDCYVADDGLPACSVGSEKWGEGYTFYASYSGKAFHRRTCQYASGLLPVNAYLFYGKYPLCDKHPCSWCHPSLPDLTWYEEYLRIKAIKDKYQID